MAFVFGDRVKETSTTTGTGTFALNGAPSGFQTFQAGIGNGNSSYYTITHDTDGSWEVGIGTVSGSTLTRDVVLSSSNGGLPVNFAVGSKTVFSPVTAQALSDRITQSEHASLDHTGLPGVPPPESFTQPVHDVHDHTGLPGVPLPETFTQAVHDVTDHTVPPLSLLSQADHLALDHSAIPGVGEANPPQVTPAERTAGTETALRSFSPEDVATMAGIHGGGGGAGKLVGWTKAETTAVINCSATAFLDDTPPLVSEGTLVLQASYAAQSTSNFLLIEFDCYGKANANTIPIAFFTKDSDSSAFYALVAGSVSSDYGIRHMRTFITPSDTATHTYKVYIGVTAGFSFFVNGDNDGLRRLGGTAKAVLTIKELAP